MEHARELQRRGLRVVPGRQRRGGLSIFSRRFLNLGLTSFSRWECTAARHSPRASRPHRQPTLRRLRRTARRRRRLGMGIRCREVVCFRVLLRLSLV